MAEGPEGVAGFAFAEDEGSCGAIHELYVVPEQRRRGTGRALAERAVAWLASRGALPRIRVEQSNRSAQSFWVKLGFEPVGERVGDAGPGAGRPAVYLERRDC